MRTCLCLCALLVPSAAWAERITIAAVSATYWTATDDLELRIYFTGPPVLDIGGPATYGSINQLQLGAKRFEIEPGRTRPYTAERFAMATWDGYVDEFGNLLVNCVAYDPRGRKVLDEFSGSVSWNIRGNVFTTTIPWSMTGLDGLDATFGAAYYDAAGYGSGGITTPIVVDRVQVVAPEPSAVALASFGVVALLAHLWRRPGLRVGRAERHRRGEVER